MTCSFFLQFDTSVELPRQPVVLDGGYTQWYLHYSPLCVGVWRWEGGGEGGSEGGTEGDRNALDYPNFPDIRCSTLTLNQPRTHKCVHCLHRPIVLYMES